jgi:hypothetical protein
MNILTKEMRRSLKEMDLGLKGKNKSIIENYTVVIKYLRREFKFPAFIDFGFFSNISHQMMIELTPIFSRFKIRWFKKVNKLALNSQLQTVLILTNNVQMIIFYLSDFITTAVLTVLWISRLTYLQRFQSQT